MSGNVYRRADKEGIQPEWNVVASTQDAQLVYGAGLKMTIVPLDSTTLVKLQTQSATGFANELLRSHMPLNPFIVSGSTPPNRG